MVHLRCLNERYCLWHGHTSLRARSSAGGILALVKGDDIELDVGRKLELLVDEAELERRRQVGRGTT